MGKNLNVTQVREHLPNDVYFNKNNIGTIRFRLKLDRKLTPEDAEMVAKEYLKKIEEDKTEAREKKRVYHLINPMYKHCIKYKVDCYSACCRFLEYRYSNFIETPDRVPSNPKFKENEGYYWNKFMKKTGYFQLSAADICKELDIKDMQLYIFNQHFKEFCDWVDEHKKVLNKHHRQRWVDYSHLAYNGVTEDF